MAERPGPAGRARMPSRPHLLPGTVFPVSLACLLPLSVTFLSRDEECRFCWFWFKEAHLEEFSGSNGLTRVLPQPLGTGRAGHTPSKRGSMSPVALGLRAYPARRGPRSPSPLRLPPPPSAASPLPSPLSALTVLPPRSPLCAHGLKIGFQACIPSAGGHPAEAV